MPGQQQGLLLSSVEAWQVYSKGAMQWPICTDQTNDVDPLGAKVLGPYFL